MGRAPRRTLSPERKGLYAVGLGLQGIGAMGFLVCLLGFAFGGMRSAQSFGREGSPVQWWAGALLCMVALVIGGMLRGIAARGVAGSGLVLDPERARTDLEPWARTGGGLLKDAVDEAGLGRAIAAEPEVKVRCRECRTLNDDEAKFCDNCGAPL